MFKQVYIIMGEVFGKVVPLVYSLTTHKDTQTYETILSEIRDRMQILKVDNNIQLFNLDFELAVSSAVKNIFGDNMHIHMCWFHFCQSLFRQVQKHCLIEFYASEDLRDEFSLICCLALVPTENVLATFKELYVQLRPSSKLIADHVRNYYIEGKNGTGSQGRRKGPKFPLHYWNAFDIMKNGESRTNNFCESFNHRFARMIGPKNPGVHPFCEQLRKEQNHTETIIQSAMIGKTSPKE